MSWDAAYILTSLCHGSNVGFSRPTTLSCEADQCLCTSRVGDVRVKGQLNQHAILAYLTLTLVALRGDEWQLVD